MTTEWIAKLPADRKRAITAVRKLVNAHLPPGFEENVTDSMIAWQVPKAVLPATYNGQPYQYAALASQKNYMALYLVGLYADPSLRAWFEKAYAKTGKQLDMGKSCVRFTALEALPLDVIGEAIAKVSLADHVARYHRTFAGKKAKTIRDARS